MKHRNKARHVGLMYTTRRQVSALRIADVRTANSRLRGLLLYERKGFQEAACRSRIAALLLEHGDHLVEPLAGGIEAGFGAAIGIEAIGTALVRRRAWGASR